MKFKKSTPDSVDLIRDLKILTNLKSRFSNRNQWVVQALKNAIYIMEKEIIALKGESK